MRSRFQNKYSHKKEQFSCTEHDTNLNLTGKIIRTSDSLKILGVTIDNKLNFNEHINDVCNNETIHPQLGKLDNKKLLLFF